MSTRCNVCVKLHKEDLNKKLTIDESKHLDTREDFPYMEIYIHHDGFIDGLGRELYKNLVTYDQVKKFILEGDRTSFDTAYSQCGEKWEDNKPVFLKNVDGDIPEMYYYLFDEDNEWYWKNHKNGPWRLLKDEFPKLRDERLNEAIEMTHKVFKKTIASDISPTNLEEIGNKIKEVIEKCTDGKYTTNGSSGLDGTQIEVKEKL